VSAAPLPFALKESLSNLKFTSAMPPSGTDAVKVNCPPDAKVNGNNESFEFQNPAQDAALVGNSNTPPFTVAPLSANSPQSDATNDLLSPFRKLGEANAVIAKRITFLLRRIFLKTEVDLVECIRFEE
jgi:hypothetical protein